VTVGTDGFDTKQSRDEFICALSQYNIVIFEGVDGAGKSTLASALCRAFAFSRRHGTLTPLDVDIFQKYCCLFRSSSHLVCDRSFPTEPVYGLTFRGVSRLLDYDLVLLARELRDAGGTIVFVRSELSTLQARLGARNGDDNWDEATLRELCRRYEKYINLLRPHVEVLDVLT
jgi:thymidylate kinase